MPAPNRTALTFRYECWRAVPAGMIETAGTTFLLLIGAIVFGISNAGTDVAWGLWVTKFAPPDRVADYMSAHTFFTGVRGIIAPLAAFQLIASVSLPVMGWISFGLIAIGTAFLFPEIKFGRSRPAIAN